MAACGGDAGPTPKAPPEIFAEAIEVFCTQHFDCNEPETLNVVGAWIDSDTLVGEEIAMPDSVKQAVAKGLGRDFVWLDSRAEIDEVVAKSPPQVILSMGTLNYFDYVAETDIGWSRGLEEGRKVTISVDLGLQAEFDDPSRQTSYVP